MTLTLKLIVALGKHSAGGQAKIRACVQRLLEATGVEVSRPEGNSGVLVVAASALSQVFGRVDKAELQRRLSIEFIANKF